MKDDDNKLASRLLYIPLDIHEKVLLWLAYKGLKPVSEITVIRRNLSLLRKGIRPNSFDSSSKKILKIKRWIQDAGLVYTTENDEPQSWHVGISKVDTEKSTNIIRKFDYENEYQSGRLFGFPKKSSEAYANNRVEKEQKKQIPMVGTGYLKYKNSFLKDKYFTPYIFYNIPLKNVQTESLVAKTWADEIRSSLPKLAMWYEKRDKTKS